MKLDLSSFVNNFETDLKYSENASCEPFWKAVYQKAFPNYVNCMVGSGNTQSQRMGIDRIVFLANGKTLAIDEKKRRQVWDDILLEYISVDTTGAPGWMEKDLSIDYLAYAFMPIKKCYLFPWDMLRRAYGHYKPVWMDKAERNEDGFSVIPGFNNGYTTWNLAVPIKTLQNAVSQASIIDVSKELEKLHDGAS